METIRVVEEYRRCMEVGMRMKVWTVLHKKQVDPGENMLLIVRILDSEQPAEDDVDADDRRTKITCCSIANFISGTDDARKIARGQLFSVLPSDGDDTYEWNATLPFLEVELFHFCYQASTTMKDYIEATRYEYGEIQVLVDISRPSSKKQQDLENISRPEHNNCCELVESVGDNFELHERVEDASTAESNNYNRKDGGMCKYCRQQWI